MKWPHAAEDAHAHALEVIGLVVIGRTCPLPNGKATGRQLYSRVQMVSGLCSVWHVMGVACESGCGM